MAIPKGFRILEPLSVPGRQELGELYHVDLVSEEESNQFAQALFRDLTGDVKQIAVASPLAFFDRFNRSQPIIKRPFVAWTVEENMAAG